MSEITPDSICPACIGCDNWNEGEGNQECLSCLKIEMLLPKVDQGRKNTVQITDNHAKDPGLDELVILREVVSRLPERERQIVEGYLEGKSRTEIGRYLGMNRSNVRRTFKRILRRIRDKEN